MPTGKRGSPAQTLGILLDRVYTAAEIADPLLVPSPKLGSRVLDEDGNEYVFVVAGAAVTASTPVKLTVGMSVTDSGNAGHVFGVAHVAIASGSYAFVQVRGVVDCNIADSTAVGALLDDISDSNGDLVVHTDVTEPVRAICLVTENATEIVSVYLF